MRKNTHRVRNELYIEVTCVLWDWKNPASVLTKRTQFKTQQQILNWENVIAKFSRPFDNQNIRIISRAQKLRLFNVHVKLRAANYVLDCNVLWGFSGVFHGFRWNLEFHPTFLNSIDDAMLLLQRTNRKQKLQFVSCYTICIYIVWEFNV